MSRKRDGAVLFLAGLFVTVLLARGNGLAEGGGPASAAAPPANACVGFVDVDEIMKNYSKTKELQTKIKGDRDAALRALEEQSQKIASAKDELELLTKGTAAYQKLDRQIRIDAFSIKVDEEMIQRDSDEKVLRAYRDIYHDITSAVEEIAKKRGLSAVLMRSSPEIEGKSEGEIIQKVLLRQVLWSDGSLDLTEDLLAHLNGQK